MLEKGRHRQGRPPDRRQKHYREQEARLFATLKALHELSAQSVEDTASFVSSVSLFLSIPRREISEDLVR